MDNRQPPAAGSVIEEATLPLDPTGVPNLDLVLGGGLLRGSLVSVVGPPGCGKTTLATQIAFAAAREGRTVLILTTLSEPTSKLLAHLRGYQFYDPELVGERVRVLSLQQFLSSGLASAADEVVALTRGSAISLVVLDGFSGLRAADPDPQAGRQFLFDIGTTLSLQGTTTIITSEAEVRDPGTFPEGTTADTILGLYFGVKDERQRRRLEVVKSRSAEPLSGLHGMSINAAGVAISPRLEARVVRDTRARVPGIAAASGMVDAEPAASSGTGRATFGLPALDALLGGGISRATTTLLIGSGGTGKTLLSLQFALTGVQAGEQVVFLGFHEERHQLLLKADAFDLGPALRAALDPGGGLTLLHQPPVELEADAMADRLLATLDRTGARRLVVDSIAVLERAVAEGSTAQRVQGYLSALVTALQARRITALFTKETGPFAGTKMELESDLSSGVAENVMWLQALIYRQRYYRVLSVLKMRYSAHDLTLREFTITAPNGIEVRVPLKSERSAMAGIALQQGDPLVDSRPRGGSAQVRVRGYRSRGRVDRRSRPRSGDATPQGEA